MSVQAGPTFKRYAANGIATVFAIPFLVINASDLAVTLNGVAVTSGFTLSGLGNPTCTATFTVAPTGDLLFQMNIPIERLTDYQTNGDLLAKTINLDLDRLWLAIKQNININSRALATSTLEPEGVSPLPLVAARASKVLGFDVNGNPVSSTLTLAQLEQQPAGAAAAAVAAQASAVASQASADASASSAGLANGYKTAAQNSAAAAAISEGNAATTLATAQKQIQTIDATVAANALTLTWTAIPTSFRSNSLTSGAVNNRPAGSNLSLVVPSGATLGTANASSARLVYLLIDNAGTIELAVINLAGGVNLDETGLISTVAISAASSSASVAYSATARSNVPYRVAGFIDIVEATAGTWASAPTLKQGCGGEALTAMSSLGYGQTWQNVTGSRVAGTTYTNTTGKPITLSITSGAVNNNSISVLVNGLSIYNGAIGSSIPFAHTAVVIVPPGATYSATAGGALTWMELR